MIWSGSCFSLQPTRSRIYAAPIDRTRKERSQLFFQKSERDNGGARTSSRLQLPMVLGSSHRRLPERRNSSSLVRAPISAGRASSRLLLASNTLRLAR